MNDIESLARKYFKEEYAENAGCSGCSAYALIGFFGAAFGAGALFEFLDDVAMMWMFGWPVVTYWIWRRRALRRQSRHVHNKLKAYHDGDAETLQQVHNYAMAHFHELIEEHRARTLGPESEWARARAPLAEALDDANKSVAYWQERLKIDPDNEVGQQQYKVVKELEDKLRNALAKVDERADLLLRFYNECEAKLAVMDRCNRDIEEARKVEALSNRTDVVIAQAEGAIQALGRSFVEEAQKIARALGDTAGTQYKVLAGEASLDNIDYVADKIVECSDSEQQQIKDMQKALAG